MPDWRADLDRGTYQLSVGVKKSLARQRALVIAVTENVIHLENGPDIAFHFSLSQRF
ncbi:MAG: DUF3187 family protein [Thermoanaerobaculia bacterium]